MGPNVSQLMMWASLVTMVMRVVRCWLVGPSSEVMAWENEVTIVAWATNIAEVIVGGLLASASPSGHATGDSSYCRAGIGPLLSSIGPVSISN